MSEPEPVVRVTDLKKNFGGVDALRGISFEIGKGSIFGLIGANGAGKTTALRCLLGLYRDWSGECRVFGDESRAISTQTRQRVGYLSEKPFPYQDLTVPDLLHVIAALYEKWHPSHVEQAISRLNVRLDRTLAVMSLGERRRAEFLLSVAPAPDLLVLDDPWLGLDALARRDLLSEMLRASREEGRTVLFTSHVLTDVEQVADRVGILVEGRLRALDDLHALKARVKRIMVESASGRPASGRFVPGEIARVEHKGGMVEIITEAFSPELMAALGQERWQARVEDLNLESIFIAYAGTAAEVSASAPAKPAS